MDCTTSIRRTRAARVAVLGGIAAALALAGPALAGGGTPGAVGGRGVGGSALNGAAGQSGSTHSHVSSTSVVTVVASGAGGPANTTAITSHSNLKADTCFQTARGEGRTVVPAC